VAKEKHPANEDASPSQAFETSLTELETVVKELESGELPLEKALALFERGVDLSGACRQQLEAAETRVEILMKKGSGVKPEPFGN